jgi:hypothetical protein
MQRTYGRRARRRSAVQVQTSDHSRAPSPAPQSRYVGRSFSYSIPSTEAAEGLRRDCFAIACHSESPRTHTTQEPMSVCLHLSSQCQRKLNLVVAPQSSSSASHTPQPQSHILRQAEVHPEPASNSVLGSPRTPTKTPRDLSSLFATPSHSRSPGRLARSSIVKRMLSRSRTELSIEGAVT